MAKKQFKTESKKLLDMMINSIYTHKEIFLRELISNASDALDKLYFRSLTDRTVSLSRDDYAIDLTIDTATRTLTVSDNGCGMNREELEGHLGTIAKSGSFDFKREHGADDEVDIIGQFGVGFYSAFMVADKIQVISRPYGADTAYLWESEGADGYTVTETEKDGHGTDVILYLKADTDDEKYGEFLTEYRIKGLVRKYSDYVRYPIRLPVTSSKKKEDSDEYEQVVEIETLNSRTPIWKRNASEVTEDEYKSFYTDKFGDWEAPARTVLQKSEGTATYTALLFIPAHAPYNYYTKDYEKGLELYSSGVMIMEKCADLLPDYFSFVKGLVDSQDLSLNISREMLQHDRQLKVMAKAIEKKIKSELLKLQAEDRTRYDRFFDAFGLGLKFGIYSDFGMHKDTLVDLVMFKSSKEDRYVTLKEYTERLSDGQKAIYYAPGESIEKIRMLPQVDAVISRGYEVLFCTDEVDEFALRVLEKYGDLTFRNVSTDALDLESEEEKEALKEENEAKETLLSSIKDALGDEVSAVRLSATLGSHPVSLATEGDISLEMQKVLSKMPGSDGKVKASTVLQINKDHAILAKLTELEQTDKDRLAIFAKLLLGEAKLLAGMSIDDPAEFARLLSELMV